MKVMPPPQHPLCAKHASTLLSLRLALHLLANLDIDLEELGYAAVQAHGLALVQIRLAVRRVYAFGCAGFDEPGKGKMLVEKRQVRGFGEGEGFHTDCTCLTPCRFPPLLAQSFAPRRLVVFDRRTWTSWLVWWGVFLDGCVYVLV